MRRFRTVGLVLAVAATTAAQLAAQQPAVEEEGKLGRDAGHAAASGFSGGWFARGLAGGLIGGPFGTGVAFALAGRGEPDVPAARAAEMESRSPIYSRAFTEAYQQQRKIKKQESAFVGGMLGTVVWTWAILRAADLLGGAEFEGDPGAPPPEGA